jgi:L-asparagine transporter-like permease
MFVLSAKGDAPKYLVKLNGRLVPYRAILLSSFCGYVAVYASVISAERVFAFLVNAAGSLMIVIYIITALAQISLRFRFEKTAPERLQFKVWLFPWLSWATIAAMVGVLLAMLVIPDRRGEVLSGLICLVVALALYAAFRLGRDRRATKAIPAE